MINISMHRGDYASKKLKITDADGNAFEPEEIYFTVKKNANYSDFLFQKTLMNGDIVKNSDGSYSFSIDPADTDGLSFRDYAFDIEIIKSPIKQTFLGTLTIEKEVTYAENEGSDG